MTQFWTAFLAGASLMSTACSTEDGVLPEGVVPDFQLVDRNPNSPQFDQAVSPRDHLQKVSGWYFMHAT